MCAVQYEWSSIRKMSTVILAEAMMHDQEDRWAQKRGRIAGIFPDLRWQTTITLVNVLNRGGCIYKEVEIKGWMDDDKEDEIGERRVKG